MTAIQTATQPDAQTAAKTAAEQEMARARATQALAREQAARAHRIASRFTDTATAAGAAYEDARFRAAGAYEVGTLLSWVHREGTPGSARVPGGRGVIVRRWAHDNLAVCYTVQGVNAEGKPDGDWPREIRVGPDGAANVDHLRAVT